THTQHAQSHLEYRLHRTNAHTQPHRFRVHAVAQVDRRVTETRPGEELDREACGGPLGGKDDVAGEQERSVQTVEWAREAVPLAGALGQFGQPCARLLLQGRHQSFFLGNIREVRLARLEIEA